MGVLASVMRVFASVMEVFAGVVDLAFAACVYHAMVVKYPSTHKDTSWGGEHE